MQSHKCLQSSCTHCLADVEGKTAAAWGAAYALGLLVGGRVLTGSVGVIRGPLGAYAISTVLVRTAPLKRIRFHARKLHAIFQLDAAHLLKK